MIHAEDSVIINRAALDRGMFTTTAFKTTKEDESPSRVPMLFRREAR